MKKYLSACLAGIMLCTTLALPVSAAAVSEELADPWALELVNRAAEEKLMPDCLEDKDLRENITRAEFAALTVKIYESMSKQTAQLPNYNPFKDTKDPEVLKAYELGIITGLTQTTFGGDEPITREQAATMLASVYKAQRVRGKGTYYLMWLTSQYWSEDHTVDPNQKDNHGLNPGQASNALKNLYDRIHGKLDTSQAVFFRDHQEISDWARESVYFMESNGVVSGVGDHCFSPKTDLQAQAALIMATRMLEKLK